MMHTANGSVMNNNVDTFGPLKKWGHQAHNTVSHWMDAYSQAQYQWLQSKLF